MGTRYIFVVVYGLIALITGTISKLSDSMSFPKSIS